MVPQIPRAPAGSGDRQVRLGHQSGYDTEREAWKACRDAMREADRGRVVKPSTRTVAQFLDDERLTAVEPTLDTTTWRSWSDCARAYVIPHVGAERLQRLDEPTLLRLYAKLLVEGRVKRDNDTVMYQYWSMRVAAGEEPTPRQVSEACKTSIHAAHRGAALPLWRAIRTRAPGIAADAVAAWHGHTERMTQAVYGRVTDDRLTAAADVFSSAVGQI